MSLSNSRVMDVVETVWRHKGGERYLPESYLPMIAVKALSAPLGSRVRVLCDEFADAEQWAEFWEYGAVA